MKADRRILRTQNALLDSLDLLLKSSAYNDIDVLMITETANIGYRTFYNHFKNVDDLFVTLVMNHFARLNSSIVNELSYEVQLKNGIMLFTYINQHPHIFKSLYLCPKLEEIKKVMIDSQLKSWTYSFILDKSGDPQTTDLIVHYLVSSVLSLIQWWVENREDFSINKIAEIYANLVILSTANFINGKIIEAEN